MYLALLNTGQVECPLSTLQRNCLRHIHSQTSGSTSAAMAMAGLNLLHMSTWWPSFNSCLFHVSNLSILRRCGRHCPTFQSSPAPQALIVLAVNLQHTTKLRNFATTSADTDKACRQQNVCVSSPAQWTRSRRQWLSQTRCGVRPPQACCRSP